MNQPLRDNKSSTATAVPLLDLKAQYATLKDQIEPAIREVCESQHFVMGPKVLELEAAVAAYSQTDHGIGVSSGTDALLVALMALEIGPGDAVITTAYSFFATAGVIARLGARPIFCDIEPDTYNLDPEQVERLLRHDCAHDKGQPTHKASGTTVRAIMPVHLFGQTADMEKLCALAKEFDLRIVEDAAQAIGSEAPQAKRAGSIGDIGCFSFFPSKNLGAYGDGGMCVTQSEELADRLRILRLHGSKPKYYHSFVGGNFRLDAIQAAILLIKLQHLDAWTAARQNNAARYDERFAAIGSPVKTPLIREDHRHIFNQYVIETEDRDGLQAFLKGRNIGSEVYYPVPLHMQECFRELGYQKGDCPVAEHAADHTLAVPVYPELTQAQQDYVVESVSEFFSGR